ncbi:helix-turn-helix domain-containing protein, partial [Ralstonia pseudosolanacearum]
VEIGGLDIPPDFRRADTLTRHGEALGISRNTLYRKLRKHGIARPGG